MFLRSWCLPFANALSFATANNLFFQNTLVAMRPLTKLKELPSTHQVMNYLHNEFIRIMKEKATKIENVIGLIATCGNLWSADNNKVPYFGTTAAYILLVKQKGERPRWVLKNTILGFRAVEGAHDGDNLGRYFFGLCRRAGIINVEKKISKVCQTCVSISRPAKFYSSAWTFYVRQCYQ